MAFKEQEDSMKSALEMDATKEALRAFNAIHEAKARAQDALAMLT